MLKLPRGGRSLTVALPGSLTRDIPHLREKTARIGLIGRSLAIFQVDRAIIYRDESSQKGIVEAALLEKILRFQETPQYLRKHLFKLEPDLQFTGILPPLRIPSHPDRVDPSPGQIREAVVISSGSMSCFIHILKDDACKRRARCRSPDRASTAGKKASSAP